jgi:hypothetical protein
MIVVLIASIPMWLLPSTLFASDVTDSAATKQAQPASRGVGSPGSFQVPTRRMVFFGQHTAFEVEEKIESESEREASTVDTLPLDLSQHALVISRFGAMSAEARLSVLQSRALPLIC